MALHASRQFIGSLALLLMMVAGHTTGPMAAWGQALDLKDRPVADIRVLGLERVKPQLVYNQIRTQKGGPYDVRTVKQDIVRITHLNRFAKVDARVEQQHDGSIILTYQVVELPLISDVQVVGNKRLPDQQLLARVRVRTGDPAHNFLIERGRHQIVRAYEEEGYFDTTVTVDQQLLGESKIVMYRVVEGVRQRIRAIYFEGNHAFSDKQLQTQIQSKTHTFLFRRGEFSKQRTLADRDLLRDFYHQRGFLEAEATRDFQVSPQGQNVILTFTVHEGPRYLVDSIQITHNSLFSDTAILEAIPLRKGDVYSVNHTNSSEQAIKNLYGQIGYIGATVRIDPVFLESPANHVEVQISIREGKPYWVGEVTIKGNHLTQDRIAKRLLHGILPGRRFEGPQLAKTRKSLEQGSSLFDQGGSITLLGDPDDTHRDVLIEVREKNTGSLSFGAAVSSDAGVVGAVDLVQRNFDIMDTPESLGDLLSGKAFRGAGQFMHASLQPGQKSSRYSASFREPHLLDSNVFLDMKGFVFDIEREKHNEERVGGTFGFGQRFGDIWSASIRTRFELIDMTNIEPDASVDIFEENGENQLSSLGLSITRSTANATTIPPRGGSRLSFSASRGGALGGDYNFTKVSVQHKHFWTVEEDFFGRHTVVSMNMRVGYIANKAPVFERFYAGGRGFRGFEFRGIGPRGIRNDTGAIGDDPVGGDFLFLFGVEYNVPIYEKSLRGVMFIDTGTLNEEFNFSKYRVSVGGGIRLQVPFLGRAPFALDLAIPIVREPTDEKQIFSFDLSMPFQ